MSISKRQILWPAVLPMLAGGLLVQATVPLARVLTTYAALDIGHGPKIVGLLSATFALLPVFLMVPLGRINDRGGMAVTAFGGSVGCLIACLMFWLLPPALWVLLLAAALLGIAQTMILAAMQVMVSRISTRAHRDAMLGNYMVAISLGQAIGPLFLGLSEEPRLAFAFPVVGSGLLVMSLGLLLHRAPDARVGGRAQEVPLSAIAATRGLPWLILLGSICVASQDLVLAFTPVLGVERGVAPATIGILLSIRALSAMLSRLCFSRAVRVFGRVRVLTFAGLLGAAGLIALALPLPVWGLAIGLALMGFGVGIALTSTVSLTLAIAPPSARGTALSLRLTANRLAQFAIPLIAGVVVGPLGAAGIMAVAGGAMLVATFLAPASLGEEVTRDKP